MSNRIEKIADSIIVKNPEDTVHAKVYDAMYDFVDSEWEEDFEDLDDAYSEQGRGEAESQVLWEVINETKVELTKDEKCVLFDKLAEEWNLQTN